jgi:chromate transporter
MILLIGIFLYVGLFTIGGGLVAIPLIHDAVVNRGLISEALFVTMIGIAESTPGPIGINMATFVGYETYGVIGALVTTTSFVLPSFAILSLLYHIIEKYRHTLLYRSWFFYLKAVIIGLIMYALVLIVKLGLFEAQSIDNKAVIILIGLFVLYPILNKKPILLIILGALLSIIIYNMPWLA